MSISKGENEACLENFRFIHINTQSGTCHSHPIQSSDPNPSYPKIHHDPDMAASQMTQYTNTHLNTHAHTTQITTAWLYQCAVHFTCPHAKIQAHQIAFESGYNPYIVPACILSTQTLAPHKHTQTHMQQS